MKPVPSTTFHFNREQVERIRLLLEATDNRIGRIWHEVRGIWPDVDTPFLIDFVEDIRDGKYNDWDKLVRESKDKVTITPI